ncbi:hypothetical protein ACFU8W_49120 [Streptomyces sp. NPDC057565]|uniref:hypothetical protein n=1 Tax=Streptomyces sp. NPDC057565 TaxID=3346169 RepID=UPI0036B6C29B
MIKKILPILATGAAVVGLALIPAVNASAVSYGNRVNNCYGERWNTDWNQDCDYPGASQAGTYQTEGACDYQADHYVTAYRSKGSTDEIDGADCTFSVSAVYTVFW